MWNYRILCEVVDGEEIFTINEVYYNEKNKPNGYIEHSKGVCSESKKGLKWQLKHMKLALKKPILDKTKFPKKYKRKK